MSTTSGCGPESLASPRMFARRSVRLFLGRRLRAARPIILSKLRILRVSCRSSSLSCSSSSSSSSSPFSSALLSASEPYTERTDPGREDTSTIICPDSSAVVPAVLANDRARSRPGSDAARLAIENPLSRRRSPKPGRTAFHGAASWSGFGPSGAAAAAALGSAVVPGRKARSTPKPWSTTPRMTLLAEPAIASTCCSTPRRRRAGTPSGESGGA
jgi:hypothetical protein